MLSSLCVGVVFSAEELAGKVVCPPTVIGESVKAGQNQQPEVHIALELSPHEVKGILGEKPHAFVGPNTSRIHNIGAHLTPVARRRLVSPQDVDTQPTVFLADIDLDDTSSSTMCVQPGAD